MIDKQNIYAADSYCECDKSDCGDCIYFLEGDDGYGGTISYCSHSAAKNHLYEVERQLELAISEALLSGNKPEDIFAEVVKMINERGDTPFIRNKRATEYISALKNAQSWK